MSKNIYDITDRLPDGLAGNEVPDDFSIPSCGIEDVDRALFNKFNKEIGFVLEQHGEVKPVPVVFAGGERFAMVKRKDPIRDENGTLILPLIAIYRTGISQSETLSGLGRGVGQDTGTLTIRTRLSDRDRDYQRVKNVLGLKNQVDVASSENQIQASEPEAAEPGTLATRRRVGRRYDDLEKGHVLGTDMRDNIFEIISIPFPEFFKATYEVTFWAQHIQHMNRLLEMMMTAYDAQGNQFKITSPKGYWFVAFVDDDLQPSDNFKDYAKTERIVKYTFQIQTTGYIVAAQHEGQRNPFRRYLSAPQISFGIYEASGQIVPPRSAGAGSGEPGSFVLSDVVELDKQGQPILGRNHSPDKVLTVVEDPFARGEERSYARVLTTDQRAGETVARLTDLGNVLSD